MIVVMKTSASEAQLHAVQKVIRELGFKDQRIHGEERNVVAVLGHVYPELVDELGVLEGVDTVVRISKPFKLASREVNPYDTVVRVGPVEIGNGTVVVIGGPCSVDTEENVMEAARAVMAARDVELVARHADILQIGARNSQNYTLLDEVGRSGKPVLLKRGISSTIEEWL